MPSRQKDDVSLREDEQAERPASASAVREDRTEKIPGLKFAFVFAGLPEEDEMKEGRGKKMSHISRSTLGAGQAAGH